MTLTLNSVHSRPVAVIGAGVLGRRIASVFIAAGYTVHLYDSSEEAAKQTTVYIQDHQEEYSAYVQGRGIKRGVYRIFTDMGTAVHDAWLAIEAVPEQLHLKKKVFGELDKLTPEDCILGSNSSSYKSSLMLDEVSAKRQQQVLNIHFYIPPAMRVVELMTDGETRSDVLELMKNILESCGMMPVVAQKESTGLIFNRLWAAVKREILLMLAEGIAQPEEIDMLWKHIFATGPAPCEWMDQAGLDTIAFIEDNYIRERKLDGSMTVDWLRENYINQGCLGKKVDSKGGLKKACIHGCSQS
ncbi:hypothetical protein FE257_008931 [Aspergillus nanangensis]|uniref:3-hydroxyacyl-CoA dehydrogenase n=1 Tax=Aspergillus nanangensis TaxID=2582783 RepID=A0AAD4CWE7_ASPNN|nr:hypothetical protein FE257_008931 [Aspergillus nanangensis]